MTQERKTRTGILALLALAACLLVPGRPVRSDVPPAQAREASIRPWSGWWWPLSTGPGPHLDDADGPLAKYDRYCVASGRPDPHTREWEATHSRSAGPEDHWWGHCHGWAAASILEPEPVAGVEQAGIRFSVADLKGLLTAWHAGDGPHFVDGGAAPGVPALTFHQRMQSWLLGGGRPLVVDTYAGGAEVWNFPAYAARLEYRAGESPGNLHVTATLTFAGLAGPDTVGTQSFTRTYTYRLTGDPQAPTAAEWEGASAGSNSQARPWVLWYPDPALRLPDWTPPGLNPLVIREILGNQR